MTRSLDEFATPTPTSIRIVRRFDAPVELVWRAHTEPELVKQWMSGGLVVCEIDFRLGGKARYVWKNPEFEMGMTAEFKEIVELQRIVYTELYDGWPEGGTTVTATFVGQEEHSKITVEIEYLSQEARMQLCSPGSRRVSRRRTSNSTGCFPNSLEHSSHHTLRPLRYAKNRLAPGCPPQLVSSHRFSFDYPDRGVST